MIPVEDLRSEFDGEYGAAVPRGGVSLDEGGGDGEERGAGGVGGEGFAVGDRGLQDYPVDGRGRSEAGHHVEDVLTAYRRWGLVIR